MQCLNLEDNLKISQIYLPHGISNWKGCSLGINNQMGDKQARRIHSCSVKTMIIWVETGGGWADRVQRAHGRFCSEAAKMKQWWVSLSSFLRLDFNFLMLFSVSRAEPMLLSVSASSRGKRLHLSRLKGETTTAQAHRSPSQ